MKTNKLELPALFVGVNNSLNQFLKDDFLYQTARIPRTLQMKLYKIFTVQTHYNFFFTTATIFTQFYIRTTIFTTIFWKKYCEILCSVKGP